MTKSLLTLSLILSTVAVSTSAIAAEHIAVSGSTSVTDVMEVLGETYHKSHPDVFIDINGKKVKAQVLVLNLQLKV